MTVPADEKPGDTIRRAVLEVQWFTTNPRALRALDDIRGAARALEQELDQLADALQEELDRQHDDGSTW